MIIIYVLFLPQFANSSQISCEILFQHLSTTASNLKKNNRFEQLKILPTDNLKISGNKLDVIQNITSIKTLIKKENLNTI